MSRFFLSAGNYIDFSETYRKLGFCWLETSIEWDILPCYIIDSKLFKNGKFLKSDHSLVSTDSPLNKKTISSKKHLLSLLTRLLKGWYKIFLTATAYLAYYLSSACSKFWPIIFKKTACEISILGWTLYNNVFFVYLILSTSEVKLWCAVELFQPENK